MDGLTCGGVTATHDRTSDPDADPTEPTWDERPLFGSRRGLPWWGAVLTGLVPAVIGAVVDLVRQDAPGLIFQIVYVAGCAAAVVLVRRRNLFGPMVQPPLIFAVVFVVASLIGAPAPAGGGGMGMKDLIFSVGLPLAGSFPGMAIGTVVAVGIGLFRLFGQRNPDKRGGRERSGKGKRSGKKARAKEGRSDQDAGADVPTKRAAPPQRRGRGGDRDSNPPRRPSRSEAAGKPSDRSDRADRSGRGGQPPRQESGNRRGEQGRQSPGDRGHPGGEGRPGNPPRRPAPPPPRRPRGDDYRR
jgi:uncharacterized protein DUF6542